MRQANEHEQSRSRAQRGRGGGAHSRDVSIRTVHVRTVHVGSGSHILGRTSGVRTRSGIRQARIRAQGARLVLLD